MTRTYSYTAIEALLLAGRDRDPAIGAPGQKNLTHGGLRALCEKTIGDLSRPDAKRLVLNFNPVPGGAVLKGQAAA